MATFILQTIPYEAIADIISKQFAHWSPGQEVIIDETKMTAEEFALVKKYMEQQNYKEVL